MTDVEFVYRRSRQPGAGSNLVIQDAAGHGIISIRPPRTHGPDACPGVPRLRPCRTPEAGSSPPSATPRRHACTARPYEKAVSGPSADAAVSLDSARDADVGADLIGPVGATTGSAHSLPAGQLVVVAGWGPR